MKIEIVIGFFIFIYTCLAQRESLQNFYYFINLFLIIKDKQYFFLLFTINILFYLMLQ